MKTNLKKHKTMGKGDKKTKRGKIIKGSYGKLRPKKKSVVSSAFKTAIKEKLEKSMATNIEQSKNVVADTFFKTTEAKEEATADIKEESTTEAKPKTSKKSIAKTTTAKTKTIKKTDEPKEKKVASKKAKTAKEIAKEEPKEK